MWLVRNSSSSPGVAATTVSWGGKSRHQSSVLTIEWSWSGVHRPSVCLLQGLTNSSFRCASAATHSDRVSAGTGAWSAMAVKVSTATSWQPAAQASVLAKAMPTRSPVKLPGPWLMAIRSRSSVLSEWSPSSLATSGGRAWACRSPSWSSGTWARQSASRQRAAEPGRVEVSIPSTSMSRIRARTTR